MAQAPLEAAAGLDEGRRARIERTIFLVTMDQLILWVDDDEGISLALSPRTSGQHVRPCQLSGLAEESYLYIDRTSA